jgi:lipoprotein-anchoring transpeptidase ErfK/SrfK
MVSFWNAKLYHIKTYALAIILLASCTSQQYEQHKQGKPTSPPLTSLSQEAFSIRPINRSRFSRQFWPALVPSPYQYEAGTVVIDTARHQLYLIEPNNMARRYGVGVGSAGKSWSGTASIGRLAKWPAWHPTDDMHAEVPGLPKRIEPGLHNPLGARAIYLYQNGKDTLYRIHGTTEPWTIGTGASSGCIRMINEDVIDLYDRIKIGTTVIVH